MRTLAARAAFNKEVIVLKLSSFSRNVKQNRRKNWRLGKYFSGIKNNAELNRWTKKISNICGCRSTLVSSSENSGGVRGI